MYYYLWRYNSSPNLALLTAMSVHAAVVTCLDIDTDIISFGLIAAIVCMGNLVHAYRAPDNLVGFSGA